jgi:putative DNA primase/helicase
MISLDNASQDIGGDMLCQITEQRIVRIRILGRSEVPRCEWRGSMFATGNNIRLVGDMTRRGLICNIDPKVERPEMRKFDFDPIEQVLANRGAYIAAALTVARGYVAAGYPDVFTPLASYGAWTKAVRAPLIWLGRKDPVKSMDASREADPARAAARTLIALWKKHLLINSGYSAAELVKKANEQQCVETSPGVKEYDWTHPELRDLLVQHAGTPRGDIEARKVSYWLAAVRGQIHEGHRIELVKESSGRGNRYALILTPKKA